MRTLAKIAAVLLFTSAGFAQQSSFLIRPSNNVSLHHQALILRSSDFTTQHSWYWQNSTSSLAAASPFERSAISFTSIDFSPVSLSWDFSGRNPFIPAVGVVGFDLRPGARALRPDAAYGSMNTPGIWSRASHAIKAALRN